MHPVETGLARVSRCKPETGDAAGDAASRVSTPSFDDACAVRQGWVAHLVSAPPHPKSGDLLGLPAAEIEKALLRIEASGAILRRKMLRRFAPRG